MFETYSFKGCPCSVEGLSVLKHQKVCAKGTIKEGFLSRNAVFLFCPTLHFYLNSKTWHSSMRTVKRKRSIEVFLFFFSFLSLFRLSTSSKMTLKQISVFCRSIAFECVSAPLCSLWMNRRWIGSNPSAHASLAKDGRLGWFKKTQNKPKTNKQTGKKQSFSVSVLHLLSHHLLLLSFFYSLFCLLLRSLRSILFSCGFSRRLRCLSLFLPLTHFLSQTVFSVISPC